MNLCSKISQFLRGNLSTDYIVLGVNYDFIQIVFFLLVKWIFESCKLIQYRVSRLKL